MNKEDRSVTVLRIFNNKVLSTHEDMHPYNCEKGCRHCCYSDTQNHKRSECALCADGYIIRDKQHNL